MHVWHVWPWIEYKMSDGRRTNKHSNKSQPHHFVSVKIVSFWCPITYTHTVKTEIGGNTIFLVYIYWYSFKGAAWVFLKSYNTSQALHILLKTRKMLTSIWEDIKKFKSPIMVGVCSLIQLTTPYLVAIVSDTFNFLYVITIKV